MDSYGSIILAGTSALNSGITLAVFSLSRKIPFFKDISNKYLSGMSNLLNQFLITLKPISSYLKLLFVFSEKNASLILLIVRGSIGMVVSTFLNNFQIALTYLVPFGQSGLIFVEKVLNSFALSMEIGDTSFSLIKSFLCK